MIIPKIVTAVEYIDDALISAAVEYNPKKKKRSALRYSALAAACLLLVLTAGIFLRSEIVDECGRLKSLWNSKDQTYKVTSFEMVEEPVQPIQLFAYAAELPEAIRDEISRRYPGMDTDQYFCLFNYAGGEISYWFPIMNSDGFFSFIHAGLGENGKVAISYSANLAAEINTLAKLTTKEQPLLLVVDEFIAYFIIGDTAYVTPEDAQYCPEYIGDLQIPDDLITKIIQESD